MALNTNHVVKSGESMQDFRSELWSRELIAAYQHSVTVNHLLECSGAMAREIDSHTLDAMLYGNPALQAPSD